MAGKICPYCYGEFNPHPKVGERQICCGKEFCKNARKKEADRNWRRRNPDYFKGRYHTYLKGWLESHPTYLKDYRRRKKRSQSSSKDDIQDKLTYLKTRTYFQDLDDIQDELTARLALPVKGWS